MQATATETTRHATTTSVGFVGLRWRATPAGVAQAADDRACRAMSGATWRRSTNDLASIREVLARVSGDPR